jgi:hypothetical protein
MWNVWGVLEQNLLESTSTVTKRLYVTECFERDLKAFLAGWLAGWLLVCGHFYFVCSQSAP